jgi:DNA-binding NtrC family response regulator
MPQIDGMELLKHIKHNIANTAVIMMTAYGSIPLAVQAMKQGAFTFITKPFRNETIIPLLERIQDDRRVATPTLRDKIQASLADLQSVIVGDSTIIRDIRRMVELCSRNDATILLTGETGTGKDLIAQTIHDISHRRSAPFVKVNCSTFPQHLIESELFGHAKGAFTGADQPKNGKFDVAQGGTIYLDDVDDIPLEHQVKLLGVIEEKVYERVGSPTPIEADIRIIASTKKHLLAETRKGTFRSDLYYRLNVLHINLPPLRRHPQDLPILVDYLLGSIAKGQDYSLADDVMGFLKSHSWPGNVRELAHALERAFLTGNGQITVDLLATEPILAEPEPTQTGPFKDVVMQTERELLERALMHADGNKSAAARLLGMKFSTFRDKLARHGLAQD